MSSDIIVSYDGTANDDDALALGKVLAQGGASLSLAYVRHSREFDSHRESLAQHDAERRLEQGAVWLGDPNIPCHVVFSASTGAGLAELAAREGASMIVFGSDYRTAPGHVEPGTSAQFLLEGGPVAVAVAPAGLRAGATGIGSIAVAAADGDGDGAARQTADALAGKIGAEVVPPDDVPADLLVVGSQAGASAGKVLLSSSARTQLNSARAAVLVVPREKPALI